MPNKTYQSCQYLAYGLLIGYFGLYAVDWFKNWQKAKAAKHSSAQEHTETRPKQAQTNHV